MAWLDALDWLRTFGSNKCGARTLIHWLADAGIYANAAYDNESPRKDAGRCRTMVGDNFCFLFLFAKRVHYTLWHTAITSHGEYAEREKWTYIYTIIIIRILFSLIKCHQFVHSFAVSPFLSFGRSFVRSFVLASLEYSSCFHMDTCEPVLPVSHLTAHIPSLICKLINYSCDCSLSLAPLFTYLHMHNLFQFNMRSD